MLDLNLNVSLYCFAVCFVLPKLDGRFVGFVLNVPRVVTLRDVSATAGEDFTESNLLNTLFGLFVCEA